MKLSVELTPEVKCGRFIKFLLILTSIGTVHRFRVGTDCEEGAMPYLLKSGIDLRGKEGT